MNRILFAASECMPFVKASGLADVCGALPKEFDPEKWDVRVVLPCYGCIPKQFRDSFETVTTFRMSAGNLIRDKYVGVLRYKYEGITYYFIDNEEYFSGDRMERENRQDIERFVYFDKAVLSMLPLLGFKPDIIHCHDWQTGFIPAYLKTEFQRDMFFWGIRSIMTIHHLQLQGILDIKTMEGLTGFDQGMFSIKKLEFRKNASMLKGGLVYADYITTVSDSYAKEIQMEHYGEGLDGILSLRHLDMQGIVNGIDCERFDPSTDPSLTANYSILDWKEKKEINKAALQKELGLRQDPRKLMLCFFSRFTAEKGMDVLERSLDILLDEFTQLVIVGTGEANYENMLRNMAWRYSDNLSVNIGNSEELIRKVYGAADAFLMPSKTEPCGLPQLVAFRYGVVPIVHETGGLKDTVIPYNEYTDSGDGFSFRNFKAEDMLNVASYAKMIFFDRRAEWDKIVTRGMQKDFSWNSSRKKYEDLYTYLIQK